MDRYVIRWRQWDAEIRPAKPTIEPRHRSIPTACISSAFPCIRGRVTRDREYSWRPDNGLVYLETRISCNLDWKPCKTRAAVCPARIHVFFVSPLFSLFSVFLVKPFPRVSESKCHELAWNFRGRHGWNTLSTKSSVSAREFKDFGFENNDKIKGSLFFKC